jgi:signal transduction histidine kinase
VKLLNRTVRTYVFFSCLLLLVSTPVFYFTIRQIFIDEIDEELQHHHKEFQKASQYLTTPEAMTFFQAMNKEFVLETGTPPRKDSIYTSPQYDSTRNESIPYRILSARIEINGASYKLSIRESLVSTKDLVVVLVSIQIGLGLLMLVGMVLINRRLTKIIWDPFYKILDQLKRYQIDKDAVLDLPRSSTAEFRDLSSAISQLVNKNQVVYQSQRDFTANASHEIQTPLAILNGKVDMLMQTELSETQAKLIEDIQHCIGRLVRLNKALLLLARIENGQFPERERIFLNSIIKNQIAQNDAIARQNGLTIEFIGVDNETAIQSNRTLIEILISNLISNAVRFSPHGSTVCIALKENSLIVSNSGDPFQDANAIFERFKREQTAIPGSGLGLAIVKKICDQEGFDIQYKYENNQHTFQVSF